MSKRQFSLSIKQINRAVIDIDKISTRTISNRRRIGKSFLTGTHPLPLRNSRRLTVESQAPTEKRDTLEAAHEDTRRGCEETVEQSAAAGTIMRLAGLDAPRDNDRTEISNK